MTTVQTQQWVGGIEKSFKFDMTGNRYLGYNNLLLGIS